VVLLGLGDLLEERQVTGDVTLKEILVQAHPLCLSLSLFLSFASSPP
jgi:hypothetical protein